VRPDIVVTANPGCLLQIGKHLDPATARLADSRGNRRLRRGASPDGSVAPAMDGQVPDGRAQNGTDAGLPLLHPVQLLDASIRGVPVPRN